MSASKTPPAAAEQGGNDPSMEDILASIRRILSEEEAPAAPAAPAIAEAAAPVPVEDRPDDVLVLDPSMMVQEAPPPPPPVPVVQPPPVIEPPPPRVIEPAPPMDAVLPPPKLLAPETEAAASSSVGTLMRTLASERAFQVHRDGPTIEDVVREELRPLLKQWLDANLPGLVERLVRAEIERVVGGAMR